jgi:predicted ATPase/class 3 adenylate cyclase
MTETVPTGTVTFLFSDIEGSTRLWEQHPEAMKAVLARHDAILRQAVAANEGYVVKTTGDGCHAAFQTAACAVAATLSAQQALQAETWPEIHPQALRVRMGVHTGEAEARAGDYYGSAVNRAARLMSVGYGGQVLVSAATATLVRELIPAGASLLDLGEHRLRDLVAPEHIYQLSHPALLNSFPALRSLDAYPNNLPIQLTSFIGRGHEIDEAKQLLASARLVTFTGSGGTGKTRLALHVAAEVLTAFPDGVWLVELAPVSDSNSVAQALAGVLQLRGTPGMPVLDLLTSYLRSRRLLLVLDNCEHLIDACARLADHLLHTCPSLTILASSREALGIAGEVSYRVPSLSLPALEDLTLDKLACAEAVQLYLERAVAANPRFVLTQGNAPAVAQICQRLDGIPLALELAAARSKLLSAEQVATRLDDRFRLLTGGSRTAVPRQQTLRAMIDWSYELLSQPERALLRRLSIFAGGWTFEAADTVCADLDVLSLLEQLVNKSLVVMDEIQGQARYHMLETIRQYAREKLLEAGEGAKVRDRHFGYFLKLSEEAEPGLRGSQAFEWFDRLVRDWDNLRAAIEWGQEGRAEDALLLISNLIFFINYRTDNHQEAIRWVKNLLSKLGDAAGDGSQSKRRRRARARGLAALGILSMALGQISAAHAAFTEATEYEREIGDPFYLAFVLGVRSAVALMTGDVAHEHAVAEESVRLFRMLEDKRWLVICLPILASFETRLGHADRAAQLRQEVGPYLDQAHHPMFMPALLGLGLEARYRRQPREAQVYFSKGLALARRIGSKHFVAGMESELAHLARERGELQEAKAAYVRLIRTWKDLGQLPAVAHQLECFAFIAEAEHEPERAVRLLGAAQALRDAIQATRRGDEQADHERFLATLREQIDADAFAATWAQGRAMDMDKAILYAVTPAAEAEPS